MKFEAKSAKKFEGAAVNDNGGLALAWHALRAGPFMRDETKRLSLKLKPFPV